MDQGPAVDISPFTMIWLLPFKNSLIQQKRTPYKNYHFSFTKSVHEWGGGGGVGPKSFNFERRYFMDGLKDQNTILAKNHSTT